MTEEAEDGRGGHESHRDGAHRKSPSGGDGATSSDSGVVASVPGMDCPSCAGKVDSALDEVDGLDEYDVNPTTGTVVIHDGDDVDTSAVVEAVTAAGYDVKDVSGTDESTSPGDDHEPEDGSIWRSDRAIKTWISGVFLVLGLVVELFVPGMNDQVATLLGRELLLGDVLLLVATAAGGQIIVRNGYYSARQLNLDIDFLMSAAILGATGVSLYAPDATLYVEAATLAFLFNIAELLERYSVDRARNSLAELLELSPDTATVRRDGDTVDVPVEEVEIGEVVLVEPGEKVPVDGDVVDGESAVNQAPITGESVPVDKTPGDEVFAGTINEQGYLEVEATSEAADTTLSRIIELVENAQTNKTEREQFVERFAGYYTPAVVLAAIVAATIPPLVFGQPWQKWFLRGIAFLVIACPCAFVISTPVSVVSGVTSAAKNGVLIKGGNHLEAMGDVDTIALDKTGTLTKGELTVTDVVPLNGTDEAGLLQRARALEQRSQHPIAEAIVAHAEQTGIGAEPVENFESITGKGVRADLDGRTYHAGKPALFEELGFDLDHAHYTPDGGAVVSETRSLCDRDDCLDLLADTIPRLQAEGKTVVLVGTGEKLEGVLAIADEVRPDAKQAIARLHGSGIDHVVMLTGDNDGTARAIADRVGVDEFRAELLPEDKVDAIEALQAEYGTVAMVGDGINDAPALAAADVGVAMGAAGTDTAIETADIALMGDDLRKLPYLFELSHTANSVIRQNIWSSLGVKALLAIGIPLGYVSVVVAVLAGDVGMTTLVTGNAMRLSRIEPADFFDAPGEHGG